ncbi:TadE/TadG family type IV pilus assembly protein [Lipingzhangella sp. LS1_29]|uniref:TadE/TadG family type IV pilus assembly protein n=1 Tax=Lipingzhangella rawalii TaxID=2055835 RepID=A0ABU2H6M4_9ACTN|nr:TadE/TadG family type IV pilus assembly protein [Lipingzhangella rawalii]MDS1270956.1 TadE/TadG family type IV pilus assembly protein [Lipingzhangella rawalii]
MAWREAYRQHRRERRRSRSRRDRGGPLLEFAVFFPFVMLCVVLAIEVFLAFIAIQRMDNAARSAARLAASSDPTTAESTARETLPGWIDVDSFSVVENDYDGHTAQITTQMPFTFSVTELGITLQRTVDMPGP